MTYIFLLSGDYIDLGKEEALSLFDIKDSRLLNNLLIAELGNEKLNKTPQRLALTKYIYKFLFESKIDDLIRIMKDFDWNSVYKGDFCVRVNYLDNSEYNNKKSINEVSNKKLHIKIKKQFEEKQLASYIWHKLSKPKVNLENPKTLIELFFYKNKVYCGLLIYENKENFESRKSHLRPFPHPSSLNPKVARALVNISGIKENDVLLDPFCGTGGFLIEAGLMSIKIIGCDISKMMVKGCIKNLKHFHIKNYKIIGKNALQISEKFDYVVTDLPYGLNSNVYLEYNKKSINEKFNKINLKINKKNAIKNLEQFYLKFLKKLRKILKKKAVIIFPSYVNYKKLLQKSKFKIEKEFEIYVHRSLTRKIVKIS